ncbi:MipA/OmpV family protein [Cellvibrio sp. UBA7661]|uniref:MipA/OmpV family protein n=1 Tax=Cellvibrio sp. UBA7661 TaxID=1946311 RepID=UPI002F35FEA3
MQLHLLFKPSIAALLLTFLSTAAYAQKNQDLPDSNTKKWELGLGVGAVSGPDYRGSDEYRSFISPIPYFVYRGKIIRSDRDGVRGNFLRTDQYEFTVSASASITPETDKSTLREGMPELGSTLELGPSLNINLTGDSFAEGWHLQIPWRAVFAIGAEDSGYIGSVFTPQFVYRNKLQEWTFTYRAGVAFASEGYHDYYYKVDHDYVTATRNYFDASGGYSGWNNQAAFSRKFNHNGINTQLAFFIRYDNIEGADFTNSSLVVSNHSYRGGIAFIWVIK